MRGPSLGDAQERGTYTDAHFFIYREVHPLSETTLIVMTSMSEWIVQL